MTDKAKLYAVKNDKGEWLGWEVYQEDPEFICGGGPVWTDLDKAKFYAKANGGHVVELAEAPEKVVVSEDAAKMLEKASNLRDWRPAAVISEYAYEHARHSCDDEVIRLMRAYADGYTVARDKKYNVVVPYAVNSYFKKVDANYCIAGDTFCVDLDEDLAQFTDAEIKHYGLQNCEKLEVKTND